MLAVTQMQFNRSVNHFRRIAKEQVGISLVGNTFYAYCSEVAGLRLFFEYNKVVRSDRTRLIFKKESNCYIFALDMESMSGTFSTME